MSKAKTGKKSSNIIVLPSLEEVSKSPFVIKKVERARAFIAKHGLPNDVKPAKKTK